MPPPDPQPGPDWQKFPTFFKEWKEVIVIAAGAIAAALTTFGVKAQGIAQLIGYGAVLLLVGVGIYISYRIKRRHELRQQRAKLRETFESRKQQRTAFRGLYPYQEGDVLPGLQRKREAQTIFTQITDADFAFGIVCGDSGCGKTSLLRCALQARLKEATAQNGWRVLYLNNPRELGSEPGQADELPPAARLQQQLAALRHAVAQACAGAPLVVILDQFEEFFIEYKGELRGQLGACLNELIHATPPTRILCAVRRDYLVDMRDLAPQLPEPLSVKTLFPLKNFTLEQAADVIKECAALDDLVLDEDLPATLASDLLEGGAVRPPELQIVCTALVSNPTVAEYRLRGGAKGILSHYIQNAIALCSEPKLGSQILRALCDFPAHAKRNPQTSNTLPAALELPAGLSPAQAAKLTTDILIQFESARLILVDTRAPEETYVLVHDYLVDAVATATSDTSTRTEEANQLLQYYVAERRDDPKVKIPFRRYRFIKKHADKTLLAEPRARQLLRASRNAQVTSVAALLLAVLISTALLLTLLTTQRTWQQTEVGRHNADDQRSGARIYALPGGERVVTESIFDKPLRLWEARTARLLDTEEGFMVARYERGEFLIFVTSKERSFYALHLPTVKKYPVPLDLDEIRSLQLDPLVFGASGNVVAIIEKAQSQSGKYDIKIWSILEQRELGTVREVAFDSHVQQIYLNKSASRLLTLAAGEAKVIVPILWNAQTGERIAELWPQGGVNTLFNVDEAEARVVTARWTDNVSTLTLWDFQTGKLLLERPAPVAGHFNAKFSRHGDFILLLDGFKPVAVLSAADLLRAPQCPAQELRMVYGTEKFDWGVAWSGGEAGTYVWDVTATAPPRLLKGLVLDKESEDHTREVIKVNRAGDRAVAVRDSRQIELYDLASGEKLGNFDLPPRWRDDQFTFDGRAFSVRLEGGTILLFSLEDGRKLGELLNAGGRDYVAFYDAPCRRAHVWTDGGRVLRYTEGREFLSRWHWPSVKCQD